MLQLLLFYKNPILHLSLSLSSYLSSKFLIFFLYGVHSYIHPDSLPQNNGLTAALRRPGSSGTGSVLEGYQSLSSKTSSELRKRNKSKEKADFDEKGAQIFRLKLDQGHIQSRLFIDQYCIVFTISFAAISCLLLQNFFNVSEDSGILANGVFVPILSAMLGLGMWFMLLIKIKFERSASRRSEKQLGVVVVTGFQGFSLDLLLSLRVFSRFWTSFFLQLMGMGDFLLLL